MNKSAVESSPFRARLQALSRPLTPWLGLGLLWLVFELPTTVKPANWVPGAMRPTLDVLALLTLWGLSHAMQRGGRVVRALLLVWTVLLFAFRIDQMIFRLLMRDDPLLYDQWFMVQHMVVLIRDLMNPSTALLVGGAVAGLLWIVWLARAVLRHARVLVAAERRRSSQRVLAAVWAIALVAAGASLGANSEFVRYATPQFAGNVQDSVDTYLAIERGTRKSPYAPYANIALKSRPDVLLFIVESYGRILSAHEDMQGRHNLLLERLEGQLGKAGWHMASAFSRAPVSGGRSWLAEGTILMGTPIQYEAVYQHLLTHHVPNFVGFLNRNGYESVLLAPSDRNRPGVRLENKYDYARLLVKEDMNYRGPAMGWGLVPDQFSLDVARKKVLERQPGAKPLFLNFHMVTSHAPWAAVPPLVNDPTTLERLTSKFPVVNDHVEGGRAVMRRLRRYQHDDDGVHPYMNRLTEPMRRGYQATIAYDLQVIERYLESREDDALVIVLGDHQPPVITSAQASFDTPVHIFSRDKARLAEFMRQGFVEGLRIPEQKPAAVAHAGLFSLFVRAMTQASGAPDQALPKLMRDGQLLFSKR